MSIMKISKFEGMLFILAAVAIAFFAGWYLGAGSGGTPYSVMVERDDASAVVSAAAVTDDPAPGILDGERININTASASDLVRLPGIGEKRAEDIILYREEHGPFRIVEELTNVSGIGEKTLLGLIDYITVGEE